MHPCMVRCVTFRRFSEKTVCAYVSIPGSFMEFSSNTKRNIWFNTLKLNISYKKETTK